MPTLINKKEAENLMENFKNTTSKSTNYASGKKHDICDLLIAN